MFQGGWGDVGSGAMSGAGMGTQIMPGWGTVIGGVAGGLGGWMFGGEDEEENKKRELQIISTLNPEQQQLFSQLSGFAGSRIGQGLPAWEGDWTTPMSAGEEWGIGKYKEAVEGMDPAAVHDWYMQYMDPLEKKHMREQIIPGIREAGVPGGTLRGTGTEGRVSSAWEQFGAGQLGRIGETIMKERTEGKAALPGYMQAAALPRLIEQQDLDRQIQEFIRTTPELNPILNLVRDMLGITTQAAFFPPGEDDEGGMGSMLGGLGQMLGSQGGSGSSGSGNLFAGGNSPSFQGAYDYFGAW